MRILLIEDEILFAELIKEALNEEGYIVDIANDGENGLWHALNNDYNLILLDLGLPDIDGMELCSKYERLVLMWSFLFFLPEESYLTE